jgi:hypothetical protein
MGKMILSSMFAVGHMAAPEAEESVADQGHEANSSYLGTSFDDDLEPQSIPIASTKRLDKTPTLVSSPFTISWFRPLFGIGSILVENLLSTNPLTQQCP